jgi:hypothetical protein
MLFTQNSEFRREQLRGQNKKSPPSPRNPGSYALSLLSKNPKVIAKPVCTASLPDFFKVIELIGQACTRLVASGRTPPNVRSW